MDRSGSLARPQQVPMAQKLAHWFRVFAILTVVWTVVQLLFLFVAGSAVTVSGRVGAEAGVAIFGAVVALLVQGVWLVALNLAIAEGLTLLLAIDARNRRSNAEVAGGDFLSEVGSKEQEPFWQSERRKLDLP